MLGHFVFVFLFGRDLEVLLKLFEYLQWGLLAQTLKCFVGFARAARKYFELLGLNDVIKFGTVSQEFFEVCSALIDEFNVRI